MELEYAGDRMTMKEGADGSMTLSWDDKGTGRNCGDCQLCCRLVPVPEIDKIAGQRCEHQKVRKGCAIYASRPHSCRVWSCRWLADPQTAGMSRPDRSHYVIDMEYDTVRLSGEHESHIANCLQMWVDPAHPDAHRTKEARAYMLRMAQLYHVATLVRFNNQKSILVFPPVLNKADQWHEIPNATMLTGAEAHQLRLAGSGWRAGLPTTIGAIEYAP